MWKTQSEKLCLRLKTQPDVCFRKFVITVEVITAVSQNNLFLILGLHVSLATNSKREGCLGKHKMLLFLKLVVSTIQRPAGVTAVLLRIRHIYIHIHYINQLWKPFLD